MVDSDLSPFGRVGDPLHLSDLNRVRLHRSPVHQDHFFCPKRSGSHLRQGGEIAVIRDVGYVGSIEGLGVNIVLQVTVVGISLSSNWWIGRLLRMLWMLRVLRVLDGCLFRLLEHHHLPNLWVHIIQPPLLPRGEVFARQCSVLLDLLKAGQAYDFDVLVGFRVVVDVVEERVWVESFVDLSLSCQLNLPYLSLLDLDWLDLLDIDDSGRDSD